MKKIILFPVLVCILMSQLGYTAFAALGKASEWAVPELTKAEAYGLIPDSLKNDMSKAITRKEFAEVCIRVYELTTGEAAEAAPASTFSDTQDVNVLKAFQLGIVTGIGEGKFGPDMTTNREQIATMLIRLLSALTPGLHSFPQNPGYTDENQISAWAQDSVDQATQLKFITGWDNQFHAKGLCTREMAVIIAKRVYEFYNGLENLEQNSLTKVDVLGIAEKYYQKTVDLVEEKDEFQRVIHFTPNFSGTGMDAEKAKNLSADTASLIIFTNAKNMFTAFAAAVLTLDPDSPVTANNLAAAISSYNDRLLESGQATEEAYQDAAFVWLYALQQSKEDGKLTSGSLNILVALGNLYLDTNRFKQAYAAFYEAYQFDKNCSGAKVGLMNYYLARGDLKNALKYVDGVHYPVIAQKVADIEKEKPEIQKEDPVGMDASEAEMEEVMDRQTEIPVISSFDFFEFIDPQAYIDAKTFIDNLRGQLRYNAPDITIISQYSGLQNISQPMGQSALESFGQGLKELYKPLAKAQTEESLESLEKFDVNIDFGVPISDIIENPEAYEDLEPNITGEENLEENVMDMVQKIMDAMNNLQNNNYEGIENVDQVFGSFSKVLPENEIYNHNPYEYGNYLDFFVQRLNVAALQKKMQVLPLYGMKVNSRVSEQIRIQAEALAVKVAALDEAEQEDSDRLAKQLEDKDISELEKARKFHEIHEKYRPQRNNAKSLVYNQLTTLADGAYLKQIRPNAEKVYNDCMGHIMLISDKEVQKSLENRLVSQVLQAVTGALNNVYVAHSIAKWQEPFECCNLPELEAAEAARREAEEAAERDQALNDEEARRKFEACEIDENSELYKRYIEPYEANINTIVFKGKISPYKSSWEVIIGSENLSEVISAATGIKSNFGAGVNFGKMTNHFSNATTYNGGITYTAKAGMGDNVEAKLSTTIGATLTQGADGAFSPNDVDIYSNTAASGRVGLVSATSGVEVSAARGTRFHGKAVITGDKYLDEYKQDIMGHWPDIDLKIWEGEYKKKEPANP